MRGAATLVALLCSVVSADDFLPHRFRAKAAKANAPNDFIITGSSHSLLSPLLYLADLLYSPP